MKLTASTLRTLAEQPARSIPPMLRILADQLEADENRLAGQRERTRKHREKNVTVTSQSPLQSSDRKVTPLSPSKEIPPKPPKETQPLSLTADDFVRASISKSEEGELWVAAGVSLHAPSPNLLSMAEPIRWKANGMDFLSDIFPAIRAAAAKCKPNSVKSWGYFTAAIADWHETRTKPMPKGTNNGHSKPTSTAEAAYRALENIKGSGSPRRDFSGEGTVESSDYRRTG